MTGVSPRKVDFALRATQWTLVAGAVWVLAGMVLGSSSLPRPRFITESIAENAAANSQQAQREIDQFAGIWKRDIRQTLIEPEAKPKPKPKPAPTPKPPKLPRLLATFVEQGNAWALFIGSKGGTRVRRSGTSIDSFDISSVGHGSARLRSGSNTYEVSVPLPKNQGSLGRRRSRTGR